MGVCLSVCVRVFLRLVVYVSLSISVSIREIWSAEKTCGRLPDFVIVGPQKTGTTALHWFLSLHPKILSSMKVQL